VLPVDTTPYMLYATGVILPVVGLTRTGFAITGWNTSPSGNGVHFDPGNSVIIRDDLWLYAEWAQSIFVNMIVDQFRKQYGVDSVDPVVPISGNSTEQFNPITAVNNMVIDELRVQYGRESNEAFIRTSSPPANSSPITPINDYTNKVSQLLVEQLRTNYGPG
jgi:hypothetical protein